jgi:hypothetical protein
MAWNRPRDFLEQNRIIGDIITANSAHSQLIDNLVDAVKGVGDAGWGFRDIYEPSFCILDKYWEA